MQSLLEAEVLLAFVFGKPREYLIAHPGKPVPLSKSRKFRELLEKRASGIPLAYLTRSREFYGIDLYVDERCFIPRPETELLVDLVREFLQKFSAEKNAGKTILDLGTGSGAIAIALAKNIPEVKIAASDISKDALKVAAINVKKHNLQKRIRLVESDLLTNLSGFKFSGIIANLPYIGEKKFSFVEKSVRDFEPASALFGGDDGLSLYEKLFSQISNLKQKPKFLIGEFGFLQQKTLRRLLNKFFVQKRQIRFHKDLAGIPRAFTVTF